MIGTGTLINIATILVGSVAGLALRKRLPERMGESVFKAVGLVTLFIGFDLAQETRNVLVVLFSLALGAWMGEAWQIEQRLEQLSRRVEARLGVLAGGGDFTRAFVGSSLLFVVGPMTILGSLNDGMRGDASLLVTKSVMDGFASVAFASTLGVGVVFSTVVVLFYQGSLTLLGAAVGQVFTPLMVSEMTAVGGLMIVGLGLNMLGAAKIRVANLLPGLLVALVIAAAAPWFGVRL